MTRNILILSFLICIVISCSNVDIKNNKKEELSNRDTVQSAKGKSLAKNFYELGSELMKNEDVGGIKIGLTIEKVAEIIGNPEEKRKADISRFGNWYCQYMNYKNKGLLLSFKINADSVKTVENITVNDSCLLKTSRQIGIGSSYEDVLKAYKDYIDTKFSNQNIIVAGSAYGGIVFDLENKKVKSIYIGISVD